MKVTLVTVASTLLLACGSSSGTGQLKLAMTDAPSDLTNVSHVNVTYDELRVHDDAASGKPDGGAAAAGDGTDGDGWLILCSETKTVDLLELTSGRFTPLCAQPAADGGIEERAISVPAGNISQLRLHVTAAQLVFNDGTAPADLTIPSGTTSGLKIDVNKSVPSGGTLEIKLDFNAAQSITKLGTGAYKMQPVLTVL
jgi:hypothetical protein